MFSIKREIEQNLTEHHDLNRALTLRLKDFDTSDKLISFFSRYIAFNRVFAGCVLKLAGTYHLKSDLFGDLTSAEIASNILAAAEDEYIDEKTKKRITHRKLSYNLLRNTLKYYGKYSLSENELSSSVTPADEISEKIIFGYGANLLADFGIKDNCLFEYLGFHIASELSGGIEFTAIDKFLRENYLDLVLHLESIECEDMTNSYYWIYSHTVVEDDHFSHALTAADMAVKCYQGSLSQEQTSQSLITGYRNFFHMMQLLIKSSVI